MLFEIYMILFKNSGKSENVVLLILLPTLFTLVLLCLTLNTFSTFPLSFKMLKNGQRYFRNLAVCTQKNFQTTLRRQNFDFFYVNFSAEINEFSLFSTSNRKWQKMAKTKVVWKKSQQVLLVVFNPRIYGNFHLKLEKNKTKKNTLKKYFIFF